MTGPVLRNAELVDVPALLDFWLRAAEGTDRHDSASGVIALLARDPQALLLADLDGEVVGSVIAGWDGWRAHLYRLAVDPAHRGRGIAGLLVGAAEERFRALGARRADAMVLDDNELGTRWWSAAGYARQPEWARWVKPLT